MSTISIENAGQSTQDIHLDTLGNIAIAENQEDIRQRVIERLQFWRNEWFLARTDGIPYYTEILTRPAELRIASVEIMDQIREVDGVLDVTKVESRVNFTTRKMQFSAVVHTRFGQFEIGG